MKTPKISQRAQQLFARTTPDQTYLRALLVFAAQNPGFEWGNYATGNYKDSRAAYIADSRPVQKQLSNIRELSWRFPSLTNDVLKEATAGGGRLQFVERDGVVTVDYTTGQYWCVEYRAAALATIKYGLRLANKAA